MQFLRLRNVIEFYFCCHASITNRSDTVKLYFVFVDFSSFGCQFSVALTRWTRST